MQAEWLRYRLSLAYGCAELFLLGRRNVKRPLGKGELARYGLDLARVQASKSRTPRRRAGKTRRGNLQAFRLGRVSKHAVRELRPILYNLARRFSLSRQVSVATTNALA